MVQIDRDRQLGIQDITHDSGGTGGIMLCETAVLWPENMFGSLYNGWEAVLDIGDLMFCEFYIGKIHNLSDSHLITALCQ